nr:efflux RND transporter permease subunit [Yoonia sp.]
MEGLRQIVVASRDGLPLHIGDVAEVIEGRELRTGGATKDGSEVVLGTVFMLIGENSRAVAQRTSDKLAEIDATLPEGVRCAPPTTARISSTVPSPPCRKTSRKALLLVIAVLFLLGNLRAALITAAVIPLAMLMTITGMVQNRISANLMSLGALDFRSDRRWRGYHCRGTVCAASASASENLAVC